ncbi:hypothetical protein V6N13_071312 [Hibiscus sabdariffa]|uniref:Uncharacterized protein n=1 Tax=Hibiscus sabdariffa TaxID=183260 RepID=A0ABR2TE47_9ROSI
MSINFPWSFSIEASLETTSDPPASSATQVVFDRGDKNDIDPLVQPFELLSETATDSESSSRHLCKKLIFLLSPCLPAVHVSSGLNGRGRYLDYVQQYGFSHLVLKLVRFCSDSGKQKELVETYNASLQGNGEAGGFTEMMITAQLKASWTRGWGL